MPLDLNSDLVPDLLKFTSESTSIPKVLGQESTINSDTADVVAVQGEIRSYSWRFMYISIETCLCLPVQQQLNFLFLFFKFWDDLVQTQKETGNI